MSELTFKFDAVPREWSKRWQKSLREAERQAKRSDIPAPKTADPKAWEEYEAWVDAAYEALDKIAKEQEAMLCEILENVPEDWLVDGAPDDLDWSDTASLEYIKANKYAELLGQVASGNAFRNQAKN